MIMSTYIDKCINVPFCKCKQNVLNKNKHVINIYTISDEIEKNL